MMIFRIESEHRGHSHIPRHGLLGSSMRVILTLLLVTEFAQSIQLLNVVIPPHAIRGQNTKLLCNYDMEGDKLYSIKWYRNGHEFYRFIPTDNPKTTIFNGNGINVDEHKSKETEIILRNVDLSTTGQFRCEISGEAPLFQTAFSEAIMAVVDLPDEGPIISGGFPRYHINDKVNVNCTSFRSKPAAKLKWYINGEQADPVFIKKYPVGNEKDGLETSTLGLRFKVREKHFKNGDLKLKCTATIATIYWKSNEESVQGVRTQSALASESRTLRNSGTATHFIDAVGSSGNGLVTSTSSTSHLMLTVVFALLASSSSIVLILGSPGEAP